MTSDLAMMPTQPGNLGRNLASLVSLGGVGMRTVQRTSRQQKVTGRLRDTKSHAMVSTQLLHSSVPTYALPLRSISCCEGEIDVEAWEKAVSFSPHAPLD